MHQVDCCWGQRTQQLTFSVQTFKELQHLTILTVVSSPRCAVTMTIPRCGALSSGAIAILLPFVLLRRLERFFHLALFSAAIFVRARVRIGTASAVLLLHGADGYFLLCCCLLLRTRPKA